MLTLAFDTSAAHCAVALLLDESVVAERFEPMTKGQAERLMGLCEEALEEAGKAWSDLDLIGVGIGPGNFTGIRIAVSAARGLSLSLGIKSVGVSALEAQAFGITGARISILDARQDKLYVQSFDENGRSEIVLCDLGSMSDLKVSNPLICVGYCAQEVANIFSGQIADPAMPISTAIARIAAARADATTERPAPLYVRAPDAAPPRDTAPEILDP